MVWIEEVGGGLNFERPKFLDLMDRIERGEASHLVVAQRDRLTRFGHPWFERFASRPLPRPGGRCDDIVHAARDGRTAVLLLP